MPTSLRSRLFLSYAGLSFLSVVLASGASLALFGRQLDARARIELQLAARRSAERIEASVESVLARGEPPAGGDALRRLPFPPHDESLLAIVDESGQVLLAHPPRSGALRGRSLPPLDVAEDGRERVATLAGAPRRFPRRRPPAPGEEREEGAEGLIYTSVPLPALGAALDPPRELHLVAARPQRLLRGQWRSMLPSVALVGLLALGLSTGLAALLARSITEPVAAMTRASERMAGGDYDVRVPERRGTDEIDRLARAFNEMASQVRAARERQREFVANVGHDLRTPLTAIRGFAEALRDGTARSTEQRDEAASHILAAAQRMATMVEALLALARLEQDGVAIAPRRFDLAALLGELAAGARPRAEELDVDLRLEAEPPLVLRADPTWLARAIGNLLDNALDASERGDVVRVRAGRQPASDGAEPGVRVEVDDEGDGIPREQRGRVFERFYRGDSSRRAGGSGLGLSIAREIVEAHGGRIGLDARPEGGTRAWIWLPEAGRDAEGDGDVAVSEVGSAGGSAGGSDAAPRDGGGPAELSG